MIVSLRPPARPRLVRSSSATGALSTSSTSRAIALLLVVAVVSSGCFVPYRTGYLVEAGTQSRWSGDLSAAGVLHVGPGGESQLVPGAAEAIAAELDIQHVGTQLTPEDLAVLNAPPEELGRHREQLTDIYDRVGSRYLIAGMVASDTSDMNKRWVIMVLIPLFVTILTLPIPVTYDEKFGDERKVMTLRVVDLESARVVAAAVSAETGKLSEPELDQSGMAATLQQIPLTKKELER